MISRVFLIMGQKNAELVDKSTDVATECPYKCRAVLQGNDISAGSGTAAVNLFQEVSSCPTTVEEIRLTAAVGAMKSNPRKKRLRRTTTRDASQAYVQTRINLPGRVKTWVRLPKEWWPKDWYKLDGTPRFVDPLVLLEMALWTP